MNEQPPAGGHHAASITRRWSRLEEGQIDRLGTLALLVRLHLEAQSLSLGQRFEARPLDGRDVHEDVSLAVIRLDEAVALSVLKNLTVPSCAMAHALSNPAGAPSPGRRHLPLDERAGIAAAARRNPVQPSGGGTRQGPVFFQSGGLARSIFDFGIMRRIDASSITTKQPEGLGSGGKADRRSLDLRRCGMRCMQKEKRGPARGPAGRADAHAPLEAALDNVRRAKIKRAGRRQDRQIFRTDHEVHGFAHAGAAMIRDLDVAEPCRNARSRTGQAADVPGSRFERPMNPAAKRCAASDRCVRATPHPRRGPVDEHDGVGDGHRLFLIMRHMDEAGAGAPLQRPQFLLHLPPEAKIECPKGLIEQQQGGIDREGAGERDALALSAGKLMGLARAKAGEADKVKHRFGLPSRSVRAIPRMRSPKPILPVKVM